MPHDYQNDEKPGQYFMPQACSVQWQVNIMNIDDIVTLILLMQPSSFPLGWQ